MKLLYLSCHAILEYDELKLFEEMGVDYFSLGSYINPIKQVDSIRPALTKIPDEELLNMAPPRENMPQDFINKFDVILVMHKKEWIIDNWEKLKHKTVIWRTIGQSTPEYEKSLFDLRQQGLKVVRYSKMEANIKDNIGCDMVIPFYKDPDEFGPWNGLTNEVIVFHQDLKNRGQFVGASYIEDVFRGFNAHVYGPNNQNLGDLNGGFLSYDKMKQKMRDAGVYFYTGTQPASYTLNLIEAMMSGIPVVAIGPRLWNSLNLAGDVYEVPRILQNGVNGFYSDNLGQLKDYISTLLTNKKVAKRIGEMGRQTAIDLFGKNEVKSKWAKFFEEVK